MLRYLLICIGIISVATGFVIPTTSTCGITNNKAVVSTSRTFVSMEGNNNQEKSAGNIDPMAIETTTTPSPSSSSSLDSNATTISGLTVEQENIVRQELIAKYLQQGVSMEVAEMEVSKFLEDKERSEQYLEMRAYAAAQADDLGIGFGLQLFGGFLIGFIGIVAPKYINAYKSLYPNGDGPIPFL